LKAPDTLLRHESLFDNVAGVLSSFHFDQFGRTFLGSLAVFRSGVNPLDSLPQLLRRQLRDGHPFTDSGMANARGLPQGETAPP
jgi:hypothetical protein